MGTVKLHLTPNATRVFVEPLPRTPHTEHARSLDALAIACPICKSKRGASCVTSSGLKMNVTHRLRQMHNDRGVVVSITPIKPLRPRRYSGGYLADDAMVALRNKGDHP